MGLETSHAVTRHPRVSLRLDTEPFKGLSAHVVNGLRHRLTNSGHRGDFMDDGGLAGSNLIELIDDVHTYGIHDGPGWWATTAWPVASGFDAEPVAWALFRSSRRSTDDVFEAGFYVGPAWRQRGLGRMLVIEGLRLAHRLGLRRMVAKPWNARSTAFFRGAGFITMCTPGNGMSGLSELDVPDVLPMRPPWSCRLPEQE